MILLDTDHLTVISYPADARHAALAARMRAVQGGGFVTTAVSVEEQMCGWLAALAKFRHPRAQVGAYARLTSLIEFFAGWEILPGTWPPRTSSSDSGRRRFASARKT